jgi:hypothetical protein
MQNSGNMNRLKGLIHDAPVHERRMEFRTYPLEENKVLVEGWLRDERLVEGYHWDGRKRSPGVVHWIGVRLLLGGWPLTILDAEAEMPEIPHELCPTTLDAVRKIIGVSIAPGFSDQVRKRLGGVRGCSHMTHLIVAMGPAALHGYWTQSSRTPRPVPRNLDEFPGLNYLVNSCQLWKKDGPLMRNIKTFLDKQK